MSTQMKLGFFFLQQYETDKFFFFCSQDNGNNSYKEYIQNLKRKSHYVIHNPDEDDQLGGDVIQRGSGGDQRDHGGEEWRGRRDKQATSVDPC